LTPNDSDVELISADTVRITKRNSNFTLAAGDQVVVSYIADTTGKYLDNGNYNYNGSTGLNRYVLEKTIVGRTEAIKVDVASIRLLVELN
jgi:hypothetical protein